jgi:hypothetical protein
LLYITVSIKNEILNLRYIFANIKKSKLDEHWKRKGLIKMPEYNGKQNDIKVTIKYLKNKNLLVLLVYRKHLIIQDELFF